MYADENMIQIKHEVMYEVAKLAFEGKLEEERDHIPMKLIPGPKPQFRCCIYKERAVVEERIALGLGGHNNNHNILLYFYFLIYFVYLFLLFSVSHSLV